MLMNQVQMDEIRQDLKFIIDSITHLRGKDKAFMSIADSLGKIDNKLLDIEHADQIRRENPTPEGPFEIMINEYQRKLIERVLHYSETSPKMVQILAVEPGDEHHSGGKTKLEELQTLRQMFQELPQVNHAGLTHGFCL